MDTARPGLDLQTNLGHRLHQRSQTDAVLPRDQLAKHGLHADLAYQLITTT